MGRVLAWLLGLVVLVVVAVGGLAIAFDSTLRREASEQVAQSLKTSVPFTVEPTVTIEGYPFAWHLVQRSFPSVRVQGAIMPMALSPEQTVPFYQVDLTLTDVSPSTDQVRARSLTGTGRLAYPDLGRLADATITHAGGDRVAFERDVSFYGIDFRGRLTGVPLLDRADQTLTLTDTQLELAGVRIPDQATAALVERIVQPFAVPLPYGLRLDAVTPVADGLRVDVTGQDVTFPLR